MTHIVTVELTDRECHALYDLLSATEHVKLDPFGASAGRLDRVAAIREVKAKLRAALNSPERLF